MPRNFSLVVEEILWHKLEHSNKRWNGLLKVEGFTESDTDRKWHGQNETQPYRGPGGLNFGWLVDQYMASLSSKN